MQPNSINIHTDLIIIFQNREKLKMHENSGDNKYITKKASRFWISRLSINKVFPAQILILAKDK